MILTLWSASLEQIRYSMWALESSDFVRPLRRRTDSKVHDTPLLLKTSVLFVCACVSVHYVLLCVFVSYSFEVCCVFFSVPLLLVVNCVPSGLLRTRWICAAVSNLHFFCRDLDITLVVTCNLLLVWASAVARVAMGMRVYVSTLACRHAGVWSDDEELCSVGMLWL